MKTINRSPSLIVVLLLFIIAVLGLYPLALAAVVGADTFLGQGVFLHEFHYESGRGTLYQVLRDWLQALPYCFGLWLALQLLVRIANRATAAWVAIFSAAVALGISFTLLPIPMILGALLLAAALCLMFESVLLRIFS